MLGNGWDGPGQNAVTVTWRMEGSTADMGPDQRQAIIDGKHVFAGPLAAADGTEKVAAGAVLDDGALWAMDWYVDGVISQQ